MNPWACPGFVVPVVVINTVVIVVIVLIVLGIWGRKYFFHCHPFY